MAAASDGNESADGDEPTDRNEPVGLRVHATTPHRTVFTEPENSDGWIATDLTVEIRR
jgi:hypothetical protein